MASTQVFSTYANTLAGQNGAWTKILDGPQEATSLVEVYDGSIEWIEAATGDTPSTDLRGHLILQGASRDFATLNAGRAIFARSRNQEGASVVVTAGTNVLTFVDNQFYTATVTTADDTKIWKTQAIEGWGSIWVLTSTALSTDIDTSGSLDDANIPSSELTLGDMFFAKTATGGTIAAGVYILKSFTAGDPATDIDLSNISSFGLGDTD